MSTSSPRQVLESMLDKPFAPASVRTSSVCVDTSDKAWTLLAEAVAAGAIGWCQTTDKVWRIAATTQLESLREAPLLDAEVATPAGVSTHVRHRGPDWQITTLTEGAGDTHWIQVIKRRAVDPVHPTRSGEVTYHAFWPRKVKLSGAPQRQIQPQYVRFVELGPEAKA